MSSLAIPMSRCSSSGAAGSCTNTQTPQVIVSIYGSKAANSAGQLSFCV